jgi:hypothetical protein
MARRREHHHATRVAEYEGGVRVATEEDVLECECIGAMAYEQVVEGDGEGQQSFGEGLRGTRAHDTAFEQGRATVGTGADHAEAADRSARIDAEHGERTVVVQVPASSSSSAS